MPLSALASGPQPFTLLGEAIVLFLDAQGEPVYWDFVRAQVVRDGVVVDFHGAVQAVRQLKASSESALGTQIEAAATAHPPSQRCARVSILA